MMNYQSPNRVILHMPDDELQKLQDIVVEHVKLEREKNRREISAHEREQIQKRINELIRQRDQMIYGG